MTKATCGCPIAIVLDYARDRGNRDDDEQQNIEPANVVFGAGTNRVRFQPRPRVTDHNRLLCGLRHMGQRYVSHTI